MTDETTPHDSAAMPPASAGSTSRWVSVDADEKPCHGDSVWVFNGECVFLGEYWGKGRFESYGASCDRDGLNSETLLGVTHWAELVSPEPPFSGAGKLGESGK
jgi:hypothetical protein